MFIIMNLIELSDFVCTFELRTEILLRQRKRQLQISG